MKTDFEWQKECTYISDVTTSVTRGPESTRRSALDNFNDDVECLIRYCEMQRNSADRNGFHDAAVYIEHCIDDLNTYVGRNAE